MSKLIHLDKLLSRTLGLCTRSGVRQWIRSNRVTVDNELVHGNLRRPVSPSSVLIDGKPLEYLDPLFIAMYKPRGFECSRARTDETELIYDLLPQTFYFRDPLLVPAGRLDKWASGLMILSQDGNYVHKLCSPKRRKGHPIRVYQLELIKPLKSIDIEVLASGKLTLKNEEKPCLPASVKKIDDDTGNMVELTLHEGRYHQIRRMLAAIDNQALSIHRTQIGELRLDSLNLSPGHWTLLDQDQIDASLVCQVSPRYQPPVDSEKINQKRAQDYLEAFSKFYPQSDSSVEKGGGGGEAEGEEEGEDSLRLDGIDSEEEELFTKPDPVYHVTKRGYILSNEDLENVSSEERKRLLDRSSIL